MAGRELSSQDNIQTRNNKVRPAFHSHEPTELLSLEPPEANDLSNKYNIKNDQIFNIEVLIIELTFFALGLLILGQSQQF